MSSIGDRYPAGMSPCYREGLSGNCGEDCSVFLLGECPIEDEVKEGIKESREQAFANPKKVEQLELWT